MTTTQQSRVLILDSTVAAIEQFGLSRFTMEDVARRSCLTRQTVYRHFGSRSDLIEAVIHREEDRLLRGLEAEFATADTMEAALESGIAYSIAVIRNHAVLRRLLEHEPREVLPFLTTGAGATVERAANRVGDLISQRIDAPADDVRAAADAFVRLVTSYALTPSPRPDHRVAGQLARMIASGLPGENT
jgi:AcrR family transcriptional regulator